MSQYYTIDDLREAFFSDIDVFDEFMEGMNEKKARLGEEEAVVEVIVKSICDYFKIDEEELSSTNRKRKLIEARRLFCGLSRYKTSVSCEKIGERIGKDHSTVLHHRLNHDNLLSIKDKIYTKQFKGVERLINKTLKELD